MAYEKKVGLGTKWGWVKRDGGPKGHFWTGEMLSKHPVGAAFRVAPHPYQDGWTVDLLPWLGPWEAYLDGPFKTPQAAARALVEKSKTWRSAPYLGGKKRHATSAKKNSSIVAEVRGLLK